MAGTIGWMWSNPLQMSMISDVGLLRGSVNCVLYASGGLVVPLIYTWFVTGKSEPLMSVRGLAAGVVAGLASGPFVQPGVAFLIGLLAGSTVPFITYVIDTRLRLNDVTGSVSISGLPAIVGLLLVGIFADGAVGQGWHMTGLDSYLGVEGQGVAGFFAGSGFPDGFSRSASGAGDRHSNAGAVGLSGRHVGLCTARSVAPWPYSFQLMLRQAIAVSR